MKVQDKPHRASNLIEALRARLKLAEDGNARGFHHKVVEERRRVRFHLGQRNLQ